jgi:hypothetical protein
MSRARDQSTSIALGDLEGLAGLLSDIEFSTTPE